MRLKLLAAALAILPATWVSAQGGDAPAVAPKPAALTADGIPPVPLELAQRTRPYMEYRTAGFSGWNARDRKFCVPAWSGISQFLLVSLCRIICTSCCVDSTMTARSRIV